MLSPSVIVRLLTITTTLYDMLTYPIYFLLQRPDKRLRESKHPSHVKTEVIQKDATSITYNSTWTNKKGSTLLTKSAYLDTLDKIFATALEKNKNKQCLGTRKIFGKEDELQPDGKTLKKLKLGGYIWKTGTEVKSQVLAVSNALRKIGIKPKDRICLYAETRAEWMISAMAAFQQNITIVTLYPTLGEESVIHGINFTEVELIITSHELSKIRKLVNNCQKLKYVIYLEDPLRKQDPSGFAAHVSVFSFTEFVKIGSQCNYETNPPGSDDIAVLMFTSGSTGIPKGVELTHKNIVTTVLSLTDHLSPFNPSDRYIAYLPLAHIFEFVMETMFFYAGLPIGYGTPLTLTDTSPKVMAGVKGDATLLKPTFMIAVPLVLDRLCKGIKGKVKQGGGLKEAVFKFFYDYKVKWYYKGFSCPWTDALVFKKVRALLGGRVRVICSGGAPLSPDTAEFIRAVTGAHIVQGYASTETTLSGTATLLTDMSVGRVGIPSPQIGFRLVNWEEGGYLVTDKPYPRGEIVVGGDSIAKGYFKMPDQTELDFFEEGGRRWFRTGDIGQVEEDFVVRIIDRKKDLVKLQNGEYVSLGKVETCFKSSLVVDNICVFADPSTVFCVALVVPVPALLEVLGPQLGKSGPWEELCLDPEIINYVLEYLQRYGREKGLAKWEIPAAIKLCREVWDAESGLVTAAFKLRRKIIREKYQKDLKKLIVKCKASSL